MSTLISGGAKGADTLWAIYAEKYGHNIIHYITGRINGPNQYVVTDEQLNVVKPFVVHANKTLGRRYPTKPYINKLLERNFYQINNTNSLYSVGYLEPDGRIKGGTAWANQMFYQQYGSTKPAYFFDQFRERWYLMIGDPGSSNLTVFDDRWENINKPPRPSGVYTGIGSRELLISGQEAIKNLYTN